MAEHTPQAPFLNTFGGSLAGPLAAVEIESVDYVFLTKATLGWSPELYPVILVSSEAAISAISVLSLDGETWTTYPGTTTSTNADEVAVIRGRWKGIRLTTEGPAYVKGDIIHQAYSNPL